MPRRSHEWTLLGGQPVQPAQPAGAERALQGAIGRAVGVSAARVSSSRRESLDRRDGQLRSALKLAGLREIAGDSKAGVVRRILGGDPPTLPSGRVAGSVVPGPSAVRTVLSWA